MAVNKVQRKNGEIILDVTGVTASPSDVVPGKKFVNAEGVLVDGTMPSATQATPSITVSSGGLITASATQTAGRVAAGTKSATKQLTTQAAKTVTPTTSEQVAVAAGVYTTGEVKVAGVSYDERAAFREGLQWLQTSELYALYADVPNLIGGAYTVRAHVNSWLSDSVHNNPTAYPNATYRAAVGQAFDVIDAYAASQGGGTESIVTGQIRNTSYKVKTISGLSFKKIKAFYIGAAYTMTTGTATNVAGYLFYNDTPYIRVTGYNNQTSTNLIASGSGHTYTYSNGTLTVTLADQYMTAAQLVYFIVGEV